MRTKEMIKTESTRYFRSTSYGEEYKCPECGQWATADYIDNGIGNQRCGPFHCECGWVEDTTPAFIDILDNDTRNYMNYNQLFDQLASISSRNEKIAYLGKFRDDETLKRIIKLTLDPMINFWVKKIPSYTSFNDEHVSLESALDSLEILSSRSLTGNSAIAHLQIMLESLSADDAKVIERIISKDLKCGASIGTVNSVWFDLIHEFPVMLCSPNKPNFLKKIQYPAMVQLKEDGARVAIIVFDGEVSYCTRNGKPIEINTPELDAVFLSGNMNRKVFDGELLVRDPVLGILDRKTGNGIINKAVKGTISEKEKSMIVVRIWDIIDLDDFNNGISRVPYKDRFASLQSFYYQTKGPRVSIVDSNVVNSFDEAMEIYEQYLSQGFEGIILKNLSSFWSNTRSREQLKFKNELECDLKVVGIIEGTGKYTGMIGSLLAESSDGLVQVGVGTGLSDQDRARPHNEYLGKIIAVKYNEKIKGKGVNAVMSLFLPVLLEVREDKAEADESWRIK